MPIYNFKADPGNPMAGICTKCQTRVVVKTGKNNSQYLVNEADNEYHITYPNGQAQCTPPKENPQTTEPTRHSNQTITSLVDWRDNTNVRWSLEYFQQLSKKVFSSMFEVAEATIQGGDQRDKRMFAAGLVHDYFVWSATNEPTPEWVNEQKRLLDEALKEKQETESDTK